MDYTTLFSKRCYSYFEAMKKYPTAMSEEFRVVASKIEKEGTSVVSIPAGCVELQEFLPAQTTYFPFEIDTTFGSLVNQPVCSLSSIPLPSNSINTVLSVAALHHSTPEERKLFYKEAHRILKEGGKLLVADVAKDSKEDLWLNTFVNKYNPLGHKGLFWSSSDIELLKEFFIDVQMEEAKYSWNFEKRIDMIDFCRSLFFLEASDESIDSSLSEILGADEKHMPWSLLLFSATKKTNPFTTFTFPKPENWSSLKLFEKLGIYKNHITADYVPFVDKLCVKEYITNQTKGACKVGEVIRLLKDHTDIHQEDLIPGYVLKTTHASGWNIFIRPETNLEKVRNKLVEWNTFYKGNNEQHYQFINPRFFLEKRIDDYKYGTKQKAITFMFRCIHGEPISMNVRDFTKETFGSAQNNYFLTGELIQKASFPFTLPPQVKQMEEFARLLSKPFEFVRVDFYLSAAGDIYFSEFTFTPSGGTAFYPEPLEIEFGKRWI